MRADQHTLAALRRRLAAMEAGEAPGATELFSLGASGPDAMLGGGLARGRLHEIQGPLTADAPAAGGQAGALALRAGGGRPLLWAREAFLDAEAGRLYAPGLRELGLDPAELVLVRAKEAAGVLRAGMDAVCCSALGAVVIEIHGAPKVLDLKATRRLALAAGRSGVTLFLLRIAAPPLPSAATTRWSVRAAPSRPLEAGAPGRPAFALTLLRHRGGVAGHTWHVEWDRDRHAFADAAPLSRPMVSVPPGRPAPADGTGGAKGLRRTG